jgi:hypothetical protein
VRRAWYICRRRLPGFPSSLVPAMFLALSLRQKIPVDPPARSKTWPQIQRVIGQITLQRITCARRRGGVAILGLMGNAQKDHTAELERAARRESCYDYRMMSSPTTLKGLSGSCDTGGARLYNGIQPRLGSCFRSSPQEYLLRPDY